MPFPAGVVITDAILDDVEVRWRRGESREAIAAIYHVKAGRLFTEFRWRRPDAYLAIKRARAQYSATRATAKQQEAREVWKAQEMAKDASLGGPLPTPVKRGKGIYLPGSGAPYAVPEERRDPPRWPVREMAAFSAEELDALQQRAVQVLTTGLGSAGVGVMRRKWED